MRQDYFTRFAKQLLAMQLQDLDSTEWSDVGDWLADAPQNAPSSAMAVWTELMCSAIANGTNKSENDPQLVASLGGYLDRLLTVSGSDFAEITVLPAFESLMRWARRSSEGLNHPSIEELIKSGWSPLPFMRHIEENRRTILDANLVKQKYPVPLDVTGAGGFYTLIQQVIARGQWTPEFSPHYGLLFENYFISEVDNADNEIRFICNVLLAAPSALDKGLRFAGRQDFLREAHLNAFFPMKLEAVNPELFLDSLVAFVVDEPYAVRGKTMPLLKQHHPDLAYMIELHCALFPDAEPLNTYAGVLVEPYLRMLAPNKAILDDVDPAIFGDLACS